MSDLSDQLRALLGYGRDVAQGASNALAGNISGPVDAISWGLRKAGLGGVIGNAPVGGSDWMAQRGLTPQPQNALAGGAGETLGLLSPLAWSKTPQIANGLLQMGENAARPSLLNPQMGAVDTSSLVSIFKQKQALEDALVQKARQMEGMRAAMRDPETGQIYTGWSHQGAINSVPKGDTTGAWGRLSNEWDQATDNSGFLDRAGNFISRSDAEKNFGVLTMEDIRDKLRNR